jgi:phosphatidylglycerol:prolipoprotein diacylglycerol transferase
MPLFITHPEWLGPEIIPGLPFRWYGLMYIFAFVTAYLLFRYQVKKRALDLNKDVMLNTFFWGIIGLLFGARIFYMFFFDRSNTFIQAPWSIILPFDKNWTFTGYQGMNWYGGVVGAAAAMIIYLRFKKQDILEWADLLIIGVPLGHTFGRIGNFINGELYGRLTSAPWGMVFRESESYEGVHGPIGLPTSDPRVVEYANQAGISTKAPYIALPRHPTQIYEMLFESLLIWAILWFVFRNRKPFKGFILGLYVAMYGLVRFVIDYFREPLRLSFLLKLGPQDNPPYLLLSPFNFSLDQLFSFAMLAAGIIMLVVFAKKAKRGTLAPEAADKTDMRKMKKKIGKEEE